MLQCWQYGAAKEQAENWVSVRLLIEDKQGCAIALSQFLVKKLSFLGGVARLNRGPLLIGSVEPGREEEAALSVIGALLRECKRRRWWLVQMAPELHDTEMTKRALQSLGLRQLPVPPA